jgi:hypothetical protein
MSNRIYKALGDWKNLVAGNKKGAIVGAVVLPPLLNLGVTLAESLGVPNPHLFHYGDVDVSLLMYQGQETAKLIIQYGAMIVDKVAPLIKYNLIPDVPVAVTLGAMVQESLKDK